jgi:hypothetical protein
MALLNGHERRFLVDSVEQVQQQSSWIERDHRGVGRSGPALLLGWLDVRHRYQFRQLPEVLGCGCEEELIAGTIRSS